MEFEQNQTLPESMVNLITECSMRFVGRRSIFNTAIITIVA